jgi:hypothetical protein
VRSSTRRGTATHNRSPKPATIICGVSAGATATFNGNVVQFVTELPFGGIIHFQKQRAISVPENSSKS